VQAIVDFVIIAAIFYSSVRSTILPAGGGA
jgi:hypothetical protein